MKQSNRRARTDSIETQLSHHRNHSVFVWPERIALPEDETKARAALAIADDVYSTRVPADWRPTDSSLISEYAILTADLEFLQTHLTNGGYFTEVPGRNGKRVVASPTGDEFVALTDLVPSRAVSRHLSAAKSLCDEAFAPPLPEHHWSRKAVRT